MLHPLHGQIGDAFFFLIFNFFILLDCNVCTTCISKRPEGGILYPGTGILDGYKPACGARNNSGPLQEKQMLFTAEP